jgi:hypothetical protein
MSEPGSLCDAAPVQAAFFGGPWADQVKTLTGPPKPWQAIEVPVPPQIIDCWLNPDAALEPMRTARYRLGGISDDGTRRYYLET